MSSDSELLVVAIGVGVGAAATAISRVVAGAFRDRRQWRRPAGNPRLAAELQLSQDAALRPRRLRDRRGCGAGVSPRACSRRRPDRRRLSDAARSRSLHRCRVRGRTCARRSRPATCRATAGCLRRCGRGVADAVGGMGAVLPGAGAVLRIGNRLLASRSRNLVAARPSTPAAHGGPDGRQPARAGCTTCSGPCRSCPCWSRCGVDSPGPSDGQASRTAVCAIALMAMALDATFLRNPLSTRLADDTVPAALLGAWLLGLVWSMKAPPAMAWSMRALSAVVLVCTLVAIWHVGDVTDKLDEVGVFEDDLEHLQEHTAGLITALTMPEMDTRKLPSRVSAGLVPFFRYLDRLYRNDRSPPRLRSVPRRVRPCASRVSRAGTSRSWRPSTTPTPINA